MPVAAVAQPARQLSQKQEQGERRALASFAAGRYDEAVQIYSELYADYRDPVYLRNIGRCYQKLKDPDRAIDSFREYLLKARDVSPDERREVEGFIKEMEQLQAARAPAPSPPPPPNPVVSLVPPMVPAAEPSVAATAEPVAPARQSPPMYRTIWFWGAIAGVAALGVGVLVLSGALGSSENASCPAGFMCR